MRINRRNLKFYRRKINYILTLSILIMIFTIGYAFLNTSININGTGYIDKAEWSVYFDSINVKTGSVTPTTAPSITDDTNITFGALLDNPGDFYEFTVNIVNDGTIPAMIDGYTITPTLTAEQANYFDFGVTYSDGAALASKQLLAAGATETLRVYFMYKELANNDLYPIEDQNFQFGLSIDYAQADDTAVEVEHTQQPESFADDDWDTIVAAVQAGNTSAYQVGDTKTVDMGTLGTHTLRVANNSTPAECESAGFSETACGFVLEFADIITTHRMNPYDSSLCSTTNGYCNKGGWEYSEMRTYVNSDIYNALPATLKNAIINTTVVSGHGSNDSANFTTTDKIYLLDAKEIYGDSFTSQYNTAKEYERQLDYYKNNNVTTSSYSGAIKQRNSSNYYWWLRSVYSTNYDSFFVVYYYGRWNFGNSIGTGGVSPAFRIA